MSPARQALVVSDANLQRAVNWVALSRSLSPRWAKQARRHARCCALMWRESVTALPSLRRCLRALRHLTEDEICALDAVSMRRQAVET